MGHISAQRRYIAHLRPADDAATLGQASGLGAQERAAFDLCMGDSRAQHDPAVLLRDTVDARDLGHIHQHFGCSRMFGLHIEDQVGAAGDDAGLVFVLVQ